ncbi:MAG: SRPBCC family protein [Candidatus Izemoplasmatales bacterium]
MDYTCTTLVRRPPAAVMALLLDHDRMKEWEEGLLRIDWIERPKGRGEGSAWLVFAAPEGEMRMKETVLSVEPLRLEVVYELGTVWNRCVNRLEAMPEGTLWSMDVTFLGKDMTPLPAADFRSGTETGMARFKRFAESLGKPGRKN